MGEATALQCCVPIARPTLSDAEALDLERVFKALADFNRVKMLNILLGAGEEVCVCDFEAALDMKQSRASYHLKQLVDAGLVRRERRGTYSYYRPVAGALAAVSALLSEQVSLAEAV